MTFSIQAEQENKRPQASFISLVLSMTHSRFGKQSLRLIHVPAKPRPSAAAWHAPPAERSPRVVRAPVPTPKK